MKTITGREDDHFRDRGRGRGRVRVRVRVRGRGRGRGRNRSRGLDQITTGQSHADLGLDLARASQNSRYLSLTQNEGKSFSETAISTRTWGG